MRKIITLVVILAVLWAIPGVRGRIGVALLPLLEKLGPVADFVVRPAQRFAAKNDASNIMRIITTDFNEGRTVPDERSFQQWLKRRAPLQRTASCRSSTGYSTLARPRRRMRN